MKRSELMTLIRANIGGRTDKDAVILLAFNLALDEISKRHAFRALRTEGDFDVEQGDTSITLPPETASIREARLINDTLSYKIPIKFKTEVVKKYPNVDSMVQGQPIVAYFESGELSFVPGSDNAYTIRVSYNKRFTYFVDDDSQTEAPIDAAIVSWVTAYVWQSMGSSIQYRNWTIRYEDDLRSAIRDDNRQPGIDVTSEGVDGTPKPTSATPWLDPFNKGYC